MGRVVTALVGVVLLGSSAKAAFDIPPIVLPPIVRPPIVITPVGSWSTDFSSGQPTGTLLFGDARIAPIIEGPSRLILTPLGENQGKQGAFIVPSPLGTTLLGSFSVSFHAFIGNGSNPPADGMSVCFAPDLPDGSFGEEGAGTGLTVTFDTFDNGGGEAPAVDIKWKGTTIKSVLKNVHYDQSSVLFEIDMHPDGTLDVSWNGQAVVAGLQTGYKPMAGRFGFGARTGTLFEDHIIYDMAISVVAAPANTPPSISPIPSQTIIGARNTEPIPLTVTDAETPVSDLTLTASSSNPDIVANGGIVIAKTGTNWQLTAFSCWAGSSDITVTVHDAQGATAGTTFPVTFIPIQLGGLNQTYDGKPRPVSVTASPGSFGVTLAYNGKPDPPVNAGSYLVTARLNDSDCPVIISNTLTIAQAPLRIVANNDTKTYGESKTHGPGSQAFSAAGLQNGESVDSVTITAPNGGGAATDSVGSYTLVPSAAAGALFNPNNYQITYDPGLLTVVPRPLTLAGSRPFDGTALADAGILSVANLVSGDQIILSGNVALESGNVGPNKITSLNNLVLGSPNQRQGNYTLQGAGGMVTITQAVANVILGNLAQTYDGTPKTGSATTTPAGLNVAFSYDGSATPPTNVGRYAVTATVNNPNYTGSATGTLVINRGTASVTLGDLAQTYDGNPKAVSVTTTPPGLNVALTYSGGPAAPTNVGGYLVVATINDPNYTGSANGTLVIRQAAATVTLGNLAQTFDGSPKVATATTAPPGLAVVLTYNGSATPPTNAGNYTVVATVNDPNYTGSASGTLVISVANQPPAISSIGDQETVANQPLGPIAFSLSDDRTDADNLIVQVTASDPGLIPAAGLQLGGSGAQRSIVITPAPNRTGSTRITVSATDADGARTESSFTVMVKERLPVLSISDVTIDEGNNGFVDACFLVVMSVPSEKVVTVNFSTINDSAVAPSDYTDSQGTLTFHPQIGNVPGAAAGGPKLDALLAHHAEVGPGAMNLILSWPQLQDALVLQQRDDFKCGTDWQNVPDLPEQAGGSFHLTRSLEGGARFFRVLPAANFSPAETAKRVTIKIRSNQVFELEKSFFVELSNPANATIARARGKATVLNDDPPPLTTRHDGNQLVLTWPTLAQNYVLQVKTASGQTEDWKDVLEPPVVVGSEFQVNLANVPNQVFRLVLRRSP